MIGFDDWDVELPPAPAIDPFAQLRISLVRQLQTQPRAAEAPRRARPAPVLPASTEEEEDPEEIALRRMQLRESRTFIPGLARAPGRARTPGLPRTPEPEDD